MPQAERDHGLAVPIADFCQPKSLEELRIALAEAMLTGDVAAARTLVHTYLAKLQSGVDLEALKHVPAVRREEIQKTIDDLRRVKKMLQLRSFREAYGGKL